MTPPSTTPSSPHPSLSILTFNILAPCYKRLHNPNGTERLDREDVHPTLWTPRLDAILNLLLSLTPAPDIIALQEVWFHRGFLSHLTNILSPHFHIFLAQRLKGKMDGLAILVRRLSPSLHRAHPPFQLATFPLACSDRVGLAVVITLASGLSLLVVNAHLTFPHTFGLCRARAKQADAIVQFVSKQSFKHTVLVGDFNGDAHSSAYRHLVASGFTNCFADVHGAAMYPTTHYNHMKEHVFVDHVFLRVTDDDDAHKCRRCVYVADPFSNRNFSGTRRSRVLLEQSPRSESPSPVGIRDMAALSGGTRVRRAHNGVDAQQRCVLQPVKAVVYPERLGTEQWPASFDISDHRPVGVQLRWEMVPV